MHRGSARGNYWRCAVRNRERMKARYARMKHNLEWAENRRRLQRERWPDRAADPDYRIERQLNEMFRVRVTY